MQVLNGLSSLSELNISYNSFEGPVPNHMIMKLANSSISFLGNPGLCVSFSLSNGLNFTKISNLRQCSTKSYGLSKVATVMIMIALRCSIFVVCLLMGLMYIAFIRKPKKEAKHANKGDSSHLLNKVIEATDNLNNQYIIGRGAHGVVYKVELGPDKVFAVKKLVFAQNEGKSSSMIREIETFGMIRH